MSVVLGALASSKPRGGRWGGMPTTYAYKALDAKGEMQEGVLTGESTDTVAERVRRMGMRPVDVKRKRGHSFQQEMRIPGFGATKRADALAVFSRQFSTMIGAGIPILRCLTVLGRQCDDDSLRAVLEEVRADVENGDQLSVAVARQPSWFNEFYVAMVRSGENSGSLADVLERLATATEAASRLRRKIKSAMAYPTVVAFIIACTVAAMLLFLIPTFRDIFAGLKGELPLPTKLVVTASDTLTSYFPIVATSCGLLIWGFKKWKKTDTGRLRWDRFRLRVPVFGKLARLSALARFTSNLAVLVQTGVPFVDALHVASYTAGNRVLFLAAGRIAEAVSHGGRISDAMAEEPIFTEMVVQMVSAGEDAGAVDTMLEKVSAMYELEVETTVDSLTSLLEPLLIVLMAVTVGGMLMAVYLPMFKAVSLVK